MWTLMPQLERLLKIPDPHIHLGTDFGAARTQIEGEAGVAFRIGDLLIIGSVSYTHLLIVPYLSL